MSLMIVRSHLAAAALLAVVCLPAACVNISVNTEASPTADFSVLKTYAWERNPQLSGEMDSSIAGQRIHADVDRALRDHGFRPANGQEPDMLVDYRVMLREEIDLEGGPVWGGLEAYDYTAGTLIVVLLDPEDHDFLWRGVAQGSVDPGSMGSMDGGNIGKAVKKMFAKFPN